ncbi:hypothetical protein [Paenibacillus beijingensis]|uniref:Uncharacterized protein n=1 Tax=Paenibacillus beijingensis TaxID=1126833 RepID=A0A0D5NMC1_9BACL|nr:hypothetical protein [Paenibacillus beijingensis]AJY76416.1 hypothetical protein VN24_19890 [Paenibacillus beijingensis]
MQDSSFPHLSRQRIARILDPQQQLCREDVLWMLEYIKKKVADEDSGLTELSQPRLLQNFHGFAEAAMSMLQPAHSSARDADRLRRYLREASHGLLP